jgi:hypothetical protein
VRRQLFNIVAALSLLLCVAACALWMRSYWLTDKVEWRCDGGWRSVRSAEGRVVVAPPLRFFSLDIFP